MDAKINTPRRNFLKYTAGASLAVASCASLSFAANAKATSNPSANFHPDVEIELKLEPVSIPIFDGPDTRVWKIYGSVLKGSNNTLENITGSYLGPIMRFNTGQKVRIYLKNNLPAELLDDN